MKEFKESTIEWIGDIPEHWNIVKAKHLFVNDKQIVGAKVDEYDRLALTMKGVIKRSKDDNEGLQPDKFNTYQILNENELVFKLIDLQNISTSRVGYSSYTGIVSPAYIILKSKGEIYPKYAEKYYLSMWMNQVFNFLGDAGVRSSLNSSDLLNLGIPFPPLSEQKVIADYLDGKCGEIDEITKIIEEQINTLEEYKRSLITETVTKGLNPNVNYKNSGIAWIGDIPEHWDVCKIKEGFNEKKSKALQENPIVLSLARSGVKIRDISTNEGQLAASYYEYNPVDFDDMLLNPMDLQSGANCSISKVKGVISPAYVNLRYKEGFNPKFYDYYFKICYWSFAFFSYGKGVSFDNRWTLNRETLFAFKMPFPPLSEQRAIADYLDGKCGEIDEIIDGKRKQLEILKEYKQSVIYEYVTGKKEVSANE